MEQLFETRPLDVVGFAQVALEQGIDLSATGLTYAVPGALGDLAVGDRVLVPLGRTNKPVAGYVVQRSQRSDQEQVKSVLSRDARGLSLTADLVELARWMALYYCCPLGMVFASMLPAAVKRGTGTVRQTVVRVSAPTCSAQPPSPRLSKLQQAILDAAQRHGDWMDLKELADLVGAKTIGPVRQLVERGLLEAAEQSVVRASTDTAMLGGGEAAQRVELNPDQGRAVERLEQSLGQGFSVHLLHGVTGSGKTEVYLRVIERVVAGHPRRGAVVLVPEISLTPQMVRRFVERFGVASVALLHSGLTAAQRHEQWRRIREGRARIVVGARSAVFAPLPGAEAGAGLGVMIVDEEHDASYKQDQAPRYHGRDVAIKRAQLLGVPCVLGSATPSLESYFNATDRGVGMGDQGSGPEDSSPDHRPSLAGPPDPQPVENRPRYQYLALPHRVASLRLPRVQIVDMIEQRRRRYQMTGRAGVHLLSIELEHQLRATIASGGQAIVLLNRRGYANYIACPDHLCGWMMRCSDCDATMVYHRDAALPTGGFLRCHHCDAEQLLPSRCPVCGKRVTVFGLGTQRVEEELSAQLPGVRTLRMDSDTMRHGRDYHEALDAFGRGEVRVLVGTQMIAKGLDYPNVRLVGVISADTALHLPDFRAAERTFQLIAQVAGRAGRGGSAEAAVVIVQTYSPRDATIQLAAGHDYTGFVSRELLVRRAAMLPPISRMARIVVRDLDVVKCRDLAQQLAEHLQAANDRLGLGVVLRGPAPCAIARIARYHRQEVTLLAPPPQAASTLQRLMTDLRNGRLLRSDLHTAVDVDPVALM